MDMDIDASRILAHLASIMTAYLLALPIAWDREAGSRTAGLRTFPLVAAGACAYMTIGLSSLEGGDATARVLYGILTGIGFIGGGAILKQGGSVTGTATAASLWNTGALGVAVAWGRYEIALVLSAVTFLTLRFFPPLKREVRESTERNSEP